jgi:diketogulonate reductase-like aldo/keto reductase
MQFGTVSRAQDLRNALKNIALMTEYIDLFLIHDPYSGTERRLGAYKALLEAKAAGQIRSVGVSN